MSRGCFSVQSLESLWGTPEIEIFYLKYCPYSDRTILALEYKQIPYKGIEVKKESKPDVFETSPTVVHQKKAISESGIILQYLDEAFPVNDKKLLPKGGAYVRAKSRYFVYLIDNKIAPYYYKIVNASDEIEAGKLWEAMKAGITELFEKKLEFDMAGDLFFEKVSIVDVALYPFIYRLDSLKKVKNVGFSENDMTFKLVSKWRTAMEKLEFVKGTMPSIEDLVEFAQNPQ